MNYKPLFLKDKTLIKLKFLLKHYLSNKIKYDEDFIKINYLNLSLDQFNKAVRAYSKSNISTQAPLTIFGYPMTLLRIPYGYDRVEDILFVDLAKKIIQVNEEKDDYIRIFEEVGNDSLIQSFIFQSHKGDGYAQIGTQDLFSERFKREKDLLNGYLTYSFRCQIMSLRFNNFKKMYIRNEEQELEHKDKYNILYNSYYLKLHTLHQLKVIGKRLVKMGEN